MYELLPCLYFAILTINASMWFLRCCFYFRPGQDEHRPGAHRRWVQGRKYRSAYGNPDFRILPPSIDALEEDPTLLPPKPVQKKAGRPKGKRKRKRCNVVGEHSTSSKYNERTSAPAGGATAEQEAGATAGEALSQPTLSQQT